MELARLYAEYAPDKLLPLLRQSHSYPLEEALRLCQERQLTPATIFLLKRMGNTKEALHQIMDKLGDVHQAIAFCKEHDDSELWADLIEYSLDKPPFITTLLHKIGAHVNPILLILRIPTGLDIPQLRDSLVKIMRDYNLQDGCFPQSSQQDILSDCASEVRVAPFSGVNRESRLSYVADERRLRLAMASIKKRKNLDFGMKLKAIQRVEAAQEARRWRTTSSYHGAD
ncbi:hypothetical protein HPB52_025465 [Rhipicephalus sanguineus]|uniref:Uncharacterized protein n=1 Tax=Rhipicephalus sanguineus TaxID=34632 RepID=A0A9D4TCV7_RHISA|nr:hypothetical protein HPB52_025465 [Rhipicephalus sanguineus]